MKILFFHNTLPEYRIGWFKALSSQTDIEFVFTNEKLNKKIYGFDIKVKDSNSLKCTFLQHGLKGISELKKILSEINHYDFIELPPIDSPLETIYSILIIQKCKQHGIRVGYFWEKWEAPKKEQPFGRRIKNLILRIIPKMIYKHASIIFAVGEKSRDYFISNGIAPNKLAMIPDASETPDGPYINIREKHNISQSKKIILYLGRILPQKGVKYLIKAFAELIKNDENCHLIVAGDGPDLENCKAISKQLAIHDITFTGAVEPQIRGNYFSQCDIFVYPVTYYKGRVDVWGLTLNEAVQHGKIVIATEAVGSAYELIAEGSNGYMIQPGNISELTEALRKSLLPTLAYRAKEIDSNLMKEYCYSNMATQYIDAIKQRGNNI